MLLDGVLYEERLLLCELLEGLLLAGVLLEDGLAVEEEGAEGLEEGLEVVAGLEFVLGLAVVVVGLVVVLGLVVVVGLLVVVAGLVVVTCLVTVVGVFVVEGVTTVRVTVRDDVVAAVLLLVCIAFCLDSLAAVAVPTFVGTLGLVPAELLDTG